MVRHTASPQTHALRFGGKERFEDALHIRRKENEYRKVKD
jgi:hypothetical protein